MRPLDLDQISDGAISLSQVIVLDDPAQSFKATLLQLADFLEARVLERQFPVGSTLYRVDNRTPMELGFPGTWSRVAEGVSLSTGRADGADTGTIVGDNTPEVPIPLHAHGASSTSNGDHTHGADVVVGGGHSHDVDLRIRSDFAIDGNVWSTPSGAGAAENHSDQPYGARTKAVGDHDHAITISTAGAHTHPITVNNAGTAGATIDVEGSHLNGVLWKRTA